MTIISLLVPLGLFKSIEDYSKLINNILRHEITLNILKFSMGSTGVNLLIDVPEDKIKEITEDLKQNNIVITSKGRVSIDEDKCIFCGACVSLCPTDALHFEADDSIAFSNQQCIGCLLCIDSCPRQAISENL
ncbi:MAG: ATP-binding protein [Promethearchaeota archaeon]